MVQRTFRNSFQPAVAVWITTVVPLLFGATAAGQLPSPSTPSAQERDRVYDELAREADALSRYSGVLKQIVKLVKPTVVHLEADRDELDGQSRRRNIEEAGSGVIMQWQDRFFVLTNRHVVRGSAIKGIHIKLADGRQIHPVQVWTDPGTDIAVLEIAASGLIPARLGDSSQLEIGDFVLAIGSPFGLSHSVSYGIVSAKGRRDLQLGDDGVRYQNFLQTDAAINPGNSGGPLLNLRGEVVGINTAIASNSGANEGIGFSIPINMVKLVAQQLIENGKVIRAFLGVHLDSKFGPEIADRMGLPHLTGARVSGITPGSPAEVAKLRVGDVVLKFDGTAVEDDNDLVNRVSLTPVGKEVNVLVFRDGQQLNISVRVGDRNRFER